MPAAGVLEQLLERLTAIESAIATLGEQSRVEQTQAIRYTDPVEDLLADGVLKLEDAALFAGTNRTDLYKEMNDGRLPWFKVKKNRVIPKRALIRWLAEKQRTGK
jgi:hypothetical protein